MSASRRQVLRTLGAIPVATAVPATGLLSGGAAAAAAPAAAVRDLFAEVGVEPLINARGTMTYLSGNLMFPETVAAIRATSHQFCDMYELQDKVGAKIAEMLDVEAAMVTSGAAAALAVGTAGVLTGDDDEKIKQLPFLPGPRPEVIIQKGHRYVFDQNVRMAGIEFVEVENAREMRRAFNKNTAMTLFFNAASDWFGTPDAIGKEQFLEISHRYEVPAFVDAAADATPIHRLFENQRMGYDLVAFSGGKILRGPQSAGLLLGRKDLIEAAKLNFSPYEAPIGRAMKVNKEEIFGMYVAVKEFLEADYERERQRWIDRTHRIAWFAEHVPTVKGETTLPDGPSNQFPGLTVTWDPNQVKITPKEVENQLRAGSPKIEVSGGEDSLGVAVVTLRKSEVDVVGRRLREVLEQAV